MSQEGWKEWVEEGRGGRNKINLAGQVFGKLTVLEEAGSTGRGLLRWKCRCSCGESHTTTGYNLRQGNVQWLHKKINQIKMDMDDEEFVNLCY